MKMKRILAGVLIFSMLLAGLLIPITVPVNAAAELVWPVPGHTRLSRGYSSDHKALDIWDPNINGAPVVAAMSGTVYAIYLCGEQHYGSAHNCNGFGTGLVIKGDDGRYYQYAHMQANSIPPQVYRTAPVAKGQVIGRVGTTGNSTGPHLHFGIATTKQYWKCDVNPAYENYGNSKAATMTWDTPTVSNLTQTNAVLKIIARPSVPNKFFETGIYLYQNGRQVASKTEMGNANARNYLEIWYDINAELGFTLRPGNTYQYKFFTTCNGARHESPLYSFKSSPCTKHSFGSWKVSVQETCGKDGIEKRVCSLCGKEETRQIPATGQHVYSDDYDTTCNVCGYTREVNVQILDVYRLYNKASGEHLYCTDPNEIRLLSSIGWTVEGISWRSPASGAKVYRLFNPYDGSHLYTLDQHEIDRCLSYGWQMDGAVCYSASRSNGLPIYRLFNPYASSHYHLYTISDAEIQFLRSQGWQKEGIAWFACK